MNPFLAIARGIRSAIRPGALVALCWVYGVLAALAAVLTVVLYIVISSDVSHSAVAAQLRNGLSADWLIDTFSQPGAGSKALLVLLFCVALAVVYGVASTALSGGVVSRILEGHGGGGEREPFLAACGRLAGPMLRVTLVEIVFLAIAGGVVAIVLFAGLAGGAGHAFAWIALAAMAVTLAVISGVSDVARVHVASAGDRSALSAWRDALTHSLRRAPVFCVVVLFNLLVAVAIAWIAVTTHGLVGRATGSGVIFGLVVGQVGVLGRIWARIMALATQASLRRLAA